MKSIFFRWILPISLSCAALAIIKQYTHNSSVNDAVWCFIGMAYVHYQQFLDKKFDKTSKE